jgi:preprotein translocase subunit SecG
MVIALTVLLVISSFGLIGTVLLQTGVSAGLGAIGGAGESFFGKKKGMDAVLSKLSVVSAVVFLLSSLGVAWLLK